MEITERIIIEQLKRGNEEAYRHLYRHHYALLCHVAREYVGDDFLAETLVGDVIFHLWEVRAELDIQVSLRSYLVRAVRNHCMDYLGSKKERTEVAFSAIPEEGEMRYLLSDDYPLGSLLEHELEEKIYQAIHHLPEVCRKVFVKSRFEGKKYEEIATELNISVNTVKYHIKSALASLHAELEKYLLALLLFFFTFK
ncbi:MAG TPA: RNA polymerase sigma-70 factor [Bacteroides mediterraneensis]|uniref:RNA polymerase sigma-70 factor n=1 Tax=Bacteroides mediterraneensis TaxID=1841856 RepID=UPI00260D73E0|nr:RNA polymerase sigma-70 factor [Bacteroides mediterraneensis]HJH63093.1 RNA polymerase sigma-70 factor [Bacteroides mediterraneensis]